MKTILLVEDDTIIARVEAKALERFGYRVRVAHAGEAAVEIASGDDDPPDLVLMDIDLGKGMDGTEAARLILERRNLPIVFLTSHAERECVEKVRGITRYGYVIKNSGDFVLQSSIEMAFDLFEAHENQSASKGRLSTLLKTIPDLVWLKDNEGYYLACNAAFERFFGASEAEIIGKDDYAFIGRELADFFRSQDREAMELGKPHINEEWITFAADGRRALLETIKTSVKDDSGRVIGVLGISRDITERKRIELALQESEGSVRRKLEAIIEPRGDLSGLELSDILDVATLRKLMEDFSILTGMVTAILDTRGRILVATGWQDICTQFHRICPASSAACTESDLFLSARLKSGEFLDYRCKNNLWDAVTPLFIGERHVGNIFTGQFFYDDDEVDEAFFEAQAERYGFEREAYLAALRRVPRYSRETIRLLMDYLVRMTQLISRLSYGNLELARNIAERKRAEELLSGALGEKEMLLKELQHRVKNSLGTISSFLSLNMGDLEDERSRKVFQEAVDRVRCVGMVYEMLSESAATDRVELGRYFSDLVELLKSTYAASTGGLRIAAELDSVACDLKRAVSLGLILNELFTNALKYAYAPGSGGEIRIRLAIAGDSAELSVSDDGVGLPPGFDLSSVKSLGLRIASLLAGEIGGSLEFPHGKGTTAIVRFNA